jgi:tripartite-type tricarboxylate transporter receptor subunit TctC
MTFRKSLLILGISLMAFNATAQTGNIVRIVVPFPAGGPTDVLARVVAPKLAEGLRQTVIVENKAGATGAIGAQHVARSEPNGLTIMLGTSSVMTTSPLLAPNHPFDPVKDFVPVGTIAVDENVLVVNPSTPIKSVQDLLAYAKANPGKLNYSTSGVGSSYHLGTEMFQSRAGIELAHVPYKGTNPAVQDLVAGHVQMMFTAISTAAPYIKAGKMRALGVSSLKRHPDFPDLAPVAEAARLPGFQFATWMGLFLPAKTPKPVVERTRAALASAMKSAEVQERIAKLGMQPISHAEKEIVQMVEKDLAQWAKVIKDAGIKPE